MEPIYLTYSKASAPAILPVFLAPLIKGNILKLGPCSFSWNKCPLLHFPTPCCTVQWNPQITLCTTFCYSLIISILRDSTSPPPTEASHFPAAPIVWRPAPLLGEEGSGQTHIYSSCKRNAIILLFTIVRPRTKSSELEWSCNKFLYSRFASLRTAWRPSRECIMALWPLLQFLEPCKSWTAT